VGTSALVLVVEDDPGIRHMLRLVLESLGHQTRLEDGRGPVDASGVDVAIMDLRLGDRTAWDLLQADPELRSKPLILATADSHTPMLDELSHAVVLVKPFDLETLEEALERALSGTGASR
jgi:DNA-binding NtrC family response regulator